MSFNFLPTVPSAVSNAIVDKNKAASLQCSLKNCANK